MAYRDRVSRTVQAHLNDGESLVAVMRSARRGATMLASAAAGIGAVIGYLIATASSSDPGLLAAALGGGIGGGAGAALGVGVAWLRGSHGLPSRNPYSVLLRTDRRLLMLERAPLTNRPAALVASRPLEDVASVVIGPMRLTFPRRAEIRFTDGSSWDVEVLPLDKPDAFTQDLR